jgi:hypothetical protein
VVGALRTVMSSLDEGLIERNACDRLFFFYSDPSRLGAKRFWPLSLACKSTTMATPLLSPVVNNNAIAALQIAADGSSTPYRPSCSRAVAVLHVLRQHQASAITDAVGDLLTPFHPSRGLSTPVFRLFVASQSRTQTYNEHLRERRQRR